MKTLRYGLIALTLLLCTTTTSTAGISIGIGLPNVSIGINLPVYPELVRVPGYPVYYAPQMDANYFFYDGMYWVYQNDNWYASSWYNGPWGIVGPEYIPLYILRVPVSYYRQPPMYFRGWQSNAPPRWGQHWGRDWEQHRNGWNTWNRRSAPAPAPLPVYQRQYSGDKYPRVEQQHTLRTQQYRYQPRDKVVQQHFKQQKAEHNVPAAAPQGRKQEPAMRNQKQQEAPHTAPLQQGAPPDQHSKPPQRGGEQVRKTAPAQAPPQQHAPAQAAPQQRAPAQPAPQQRAPAAHEQKQQAPAQQQHQQAPRANEQGQKPQDRGEPQGHGQGQRNDEERGQGRNR